MFHCYQVRLPLFHCSISPAHKFLQATERVWKVVRQALWAAQFAFCLLPSTAAFITS